jgi:CO dehydrogenase/acetyl-CoA synthase delta subunit
MFNLLISVIMKTDYSKVSEVKLTYANEVKASGRVSITAPEGLHKFLLNYVFDPETIELRESFKVVGYKGSICATIFGTNCASDFGLNCAT